MVHVKRVNEMTGYASSDYRTHYTDEDFRTDSVLTRDCIKYILLNVENFELRYNRATRDIAYHRKNLQKADPKLVTDMMSAVKHYMLKNKMPVANDYDIEKSVNDIF